MIGEEDIDENENEEIEDAGDDKRQDTDDPLADLTDEQAEARARRNGWRPESEWDDARAEKEGRRKPSHFLSPREFLSRIERETPMLRERYRRSEQRGDRLEKEVGEVKKQLSEMGELLKTQHAMSLEAKKKAYDKGIADEKARQRAAVKEGDEEAYDKAEETIKQLEEEKRELDRPPGKKADDEDEGADDRPGKGNGRDREPEIDDETKSWVDANKKWFQSDRVLNQYMIEMNAEVRREHPTWSITDQLEEAKSRVMEKFPEKFGRNKAREGSGAVSRPSNGDRGGRDSTSRKFDALPPEAKAAYEKYWKQFGKDKDGKEYSKEQYLADYHDA